MNKKRKFLIVTTILLIGLIIIGGTYALLSSELNVTNGTYNVTSHCFAIDYNANNVNGTQDITGTLLPSDTAKDGLSGRVGMKINNSCDMSGSGELKIHIDDDIDEKLTTRASSYCENRYTGEPMDINEVPNEAACIATGGRWHGYSDSYCENHATLERMPDYTDSSSCSSNGGTWISGNDLPTSPLKYAIYNNAQGTGTPLSVGYITEDDIGEDIAIYSNFAVTKAQEYYYIFTWLDGYLSDSTYENLSFSGQISAAAVMDLYHEPMVNGETLTYNGSAQTIAGSAGSCSTNSVMYYYIADYTSSTAPAFSTSTWTTTYPSDASATDAGTYYMWYYCYSSDPNATGSNVNVARSVTKTIEKYTPTLVLSQATGTVNYTESTTFTVTPTTISECQGNLTATSANADAVTITSGSSYSNVASGASKTVTWQGTLATQGTNISLNYLPSDTSNCANGIQTYNAIVTYNGDVSAPSTPTYTLHYTDNNATYTSGDLTNREVYISLSATSTDVAITDFQYSTDSGSTWTNASCTVTQSGTTYSCNKIWTLQDNVNDTIIFRASSSIGLTSTPTSTVNVKYDSAGPTANIQATSNKNNITVTLSNISDNGGVGAASTYGWRITNDPNEACDSTIDTGTNFTVTNNATYSYITNYERTNYICVRLQDTLGNKRYLSATAAYLHARIYTFDDSLTNTGCSTLQCMIEEVYNALN